MKQIIHVGIPTKKSMPNEKYLESLKLYVTDPEDSSYKIEYVRFTKETLLPISIQTVPHVAFAVDDVEAELRNFDETLFGPVNLGNMLIAFAKKDEVVFELSENK